MKRETLNSQNLSSAVPPEVLQRILRDPRLMEQLSDRVYDLLKTDLRHLQERSQGYGRRL